MAIAFVVAFSAACGSADDASPGATATTPNGAARGVTTTPEAAERSTLFDVAGLIPPNFPNPSDDDWATLFGQFSETGPLIGVYQAYDGAAEPVAVVFNVASPEGLIPIVGVGVKRDTPDGGAELSIDPANDVERAHFIDSIVALVEQHEIEYLLIDTEVDRIHANDPAAFEAFVGLYSETYDAVKAVSPETKVFTAFQLEELRGEAYLTGRDWQERWALIDAFGDRLDLVGFTSYPFFDYEDPARIPGDYYAVAAEYAGGRPIAITELGWPSAPISTAPQSGYGGSEAEQLAFVERFAQLTGGLDVELVLWAFPNDVGADINPSFEFLSLRTNAGEAKPAMAAWQQLAGVD
jgi:hypothetical protein